MTYSQQKPMTPEQQEALLRYTKIGLRWVRGEISLDNVIKNMGIPQFHSDQDGKIEYAWFPEKVMSVSFIFDTRNSTDGTPCVSEFNIQIEDDVSTNILYQNFDEIGMKRIERGERIDNFRVEQSDFVGYPYLFDIFGGTPINTVVFGYRLPLADDSPYDIEANIRYLAELASEKGPWDIRNVRRAVDLREVEIFRHYLTLEELDNRKSASPWTTQ
ncbi:hypothetical protein P5W99_26440 [Paraburkholderia sp. A3BS-1L]|uniref:hypothetical protein n=1 Tax=Paraburkholderia sp. A3BS-1L TaxID=3028375 RepID=UPI003DA8DD1A